MASTYTAHRRRGTSKAWAENPWSDAAEQALLAAWMEKTGDGKWKYRTGDLVAMFPGRTRNGVIGKLSRLHAPKRDHCVKPLAPGEVRKSHKRGDKKVQAKKTTITIGPMPSNVVRLKAPPRPPVLTYFSSAEGCQFPMTDAKPWAFCGAGRISGGPYCRHHHKIAYHKVPAKDLEAA